ncbi:hypothetical protein FWH13_03175 [Candidatus Saccharibacteria bacterium]|nr:hypothetical protein [Candidatus Saccharibacteria bacterium]
MWKLVVTLVSLTMAFTPLMALSNTASELMTHELGAKIDEGPTFDWHQPLTEVGLIPTDEVGDLVCPEGLTLPGCPAKIEKEEPVDLATIAVNRPTTLNQPSTTVNPPATTCAHRIVIGSAGINVCMDNSVSTSWVPTRASGRAAWFSNGSNNTFIYGHNSSNILGGLSGVRVGQRISVTLHGQTHSYTVTKAQQLPYLCIAGGNTDDFVRARHGNLSWREANCPQVMRMGDIIGSQGYGRKTITIMTCTSERLEDFYGEVVARQNGTTSQRHERTSPGRIILVAVRD